jgi:hypothetical protein
LINTNTKEIWQIDYQDETIIMAINVEAEIFEKNASYTDKINSFSYYGTSILKSFNSIIINSEDLLQFNIHKLAEGHNGVLFLYQDRSAVAKVTAIRNKNKFVFPDGSEVLLDNRGMLTLVSSNEEIPKIYFAPVLQLSMAMTTDEEFAGNNYFYDESRGLKEIGITDFKEKYLNRFIQQIVHYEI